LPEHTVQFCDPARPGTAVYVSPLRRRWELMVMPGEDEQALTEPDRVWQLLSKWIRPSQGTLERAATYTFHSLVAQRWQHGRVMLAGDAVHQTPPFLGQGLCAAMRDVANLSWKLGAALRAGADAARAEVLLATYGPERRPHAHAFVSLAVEKGRIIQETDPAKAAERDRQLLAEGMAFHFPSPTLGEGVHRARDGAAGVGQVAPQFEGEDGVWSDDAAPGWSLWLAPSLREALTGARQHRLKALGVTVWSAIGPSAGDWLAGQGVGAALLRPDRYVFDLCADAAGLDAALDALAGWLGEGEGRGAAVADTAAAG
jgi:3-(3-hydroxy-phenyl)propionate hydroxylase